MEPRVCVGRLKKEGSEPGRILREEVSGEGVVLSRQPRARGIEDGQLGLEATKAH